MQDGMIGFIENIFYMLPAILIGFIFHEFAHAFVADKLGDPTPRKEGKLNLSPRTHIDPFGLLLIIIVQIGWAKPVHINRSYLKKPKRDDILISLAGPVTNLLISILFTFLLYFLHYFVFVEYNSETANTIIHVVETLIYWIISINMMLFVINMIPIPPLDGFHVLANLMPNSFNKQLAFMEKYGWYILLILIIVPSLIFDFNFLGIIIDFFAGIVDKFVSTIFQLFYQR
jgi:Zn-dependent protease